MGFLLLSSLLWCRQATESTYCYWVRPQVNKARAMIGQLRDMLTRKGFAVVQVLRPSVHLAKCDTIFCQSLLRWLVCKNGMSVQTISECVSLRCGKCCSHFHNAASDGPRERLRITTLPL